MDVYEGLNASYSNKNNNCSDFGVESAVSMSMSMSTLVRMCGTARFSRKEMEMGK